MLSTAKSARSTQSRKKLTGNYQSFSYLLQIFDVIHFGADKSKRRRDGNLIYFSQIAPLLVRLTAIGSALQLIVCIFSAISLLQLSVINRRGEMIFSPQSADQIVCSTGMMCGRLVGWGSQLDNLGYVVISWDTQTRFGSRFLNFGLGIKTKAQL